MASSVVSVRTEIAVPYKVVSTTGEQLPDGSYRWTHTLQGPNAIDLTFEIPNVTNIVVASVGLLILFALAFAEGFSKNETTHRA
jgi:hypothetical protein